MSEAMMDDDKDGKGDDRKRNSKKRVCKSCSDKAEQMEYKDPQSLRYFITERGKSVPRRISVTYAIHQRKIPNTIKRARHIALLPSTRDS